MPLERYVMQLKQCLPQISAVQVCVSQSAHLVLQYTLGLLASAYNTRQLHLLHFTVPWSSTTYYQMSFFSKTIREWNKLPTCRVIESDSINEFSDYFC